MNSLANLVIRLTNSQSDIRFEALPEDDPKQRKPDISIAKSKLDWVPVVNVEDGLQLTINNFRDRLQAI